MKIRYFSLYLSLLLLSLSAGAQKRFTEGSIQYDILINTASDKPQGADLLNGATSVVYLKGNKTRTEMITPLLGSTQSTLIDRGKGQIVILKEVGDQRYMINLTADNWKDANRKFDGVSFSYDTTSKLIQGYKCTKAVGQLADGTTYTVWYTTDLLTENMDFQYANRNLPGIALEYETTMGNMKVTYTASKVSFNPVPAAKFDLPKTGYRVMSYEESRKGM